MMNYAFEGRVARRRSTPASKYAVVASLIASASVVTETALAEESAYCRKVRARAAADAALLFAPKVIAEGVKVPAALQAGARLDPTTQGAGYQLRAGLSFSAIRAYKAFATMNAATADCIQHEKAQVAADVLSAQDIGRLEALKKQVAFIESRKAAIEALLTNMSSRLDAQTVTAIEVEELRERASRVARKRSESAAEIERIESLDVRRFRGSLDELARSVESSSMNFEREVSHVRSLDAWEVAVTGGYIPEALSQGKQDFFGVVQVSYSLGGPWHTSSESRYLDARAEELRTARYELQNGLAVMRRQIRAAIANAEREAAILDSRLAEMRSLRATLEASAATAAPYALARLDIEIINSEADHVFLVELVRELSRMEGR